MKSKKRCVALVLCFTLFAAIAIGSGSSDSSNKKDVVTSTDSGTDLANDPSTADTEAKSNAENDASASSVPTIEEQVLIDTNGIKITAKEYLTDKIWGDGIKLLIENSSDTDYTVGCDALIVNDYMITDLFSSKVAAGKNANETMYLSSSGLKAAGIESVGKVEMYFHASDAEYNMVFKNEYAEIHTSEYDNMDTTPNDAGTELYSADGIRIVGKTVDENSFWGSAILLYVENNSGKSVGITVDDMSINGYMITPYFSTTVYDGKKALEDITIMSNQLEENGIESIDNVELKFHIYNSDTYETIADTEPITFSAK